MADFGFGSKQPWFMNPYYQGGATAMSQKPDLLGILKQLQEVPWYQSPVAHAGLGVVGAIGDTLSTSPQEKYYDWQRKKGQTLFKQLGSEMKTDAFSPQQMGVAWGNIRNSMQPLFNQYGKDPESIRTISQTAAPQLMGQRGQLDMTNLLETLRRNMSYRGIQAGL